MRKHKIWVSVLGLLMLASICFARAGKQTNNLTAKTQTEKAKSAIASKFVGSWKLVAFEGTIEGRKIEKRERVGLLMYDAAGYMSVQIMASDRPKFASGKRQQGTLEEIKAAFDGYIAYFGPYEVNEAKGVVIHHLEGSIFPNQVGTDNIRYYEFSGDQLTLTVTNMIDGKIAPKSSSTAYLVWKRVK